MTKEATLYSGDGSRPFSKQHDREGSELTAEGKPARKQEGDCGI